MYKLFIDYPPIPRDFKTIDIANLHDVDEYLYEQRCPIIKYSKKLADTKYIYIPHEDNGYQLHAILIDWSNRHIFTKDNDMYLNYKHSLSCKVIKYIRRFNLHDILC